MSYSRWFDSTWYTFWAADGVSPYFKLPTKKLKNRQTFQICDAPTFTLTYGELEEEGMQSVLLKVKRLYSKEYEGKLLAGWEDDEAVHEDYVYPAKNPSDEELRELMGYIRKWQADVDEHFGFWTFIYHNWYIPLRNKITWRFRKW
jgi:hypothetical protein